MMVPELIIWLRRFVGKTLQFRKVPSVKKSVAGAIGAAVIVLCTIVGGTWLITKTASDYLLAQHASTKASDWARYVALNISDLESMASGAQPSAATMTFLQGAIEASPVFGYEIFNPAGYSQFVVEGGEIARPTISEFSADALRAVSSRQPIATAVEGIAPSFPTYYGRAYIPVFTDGRPIAVVAAYVDHVTQRYAFYEIAAVAATTICLLMALSFGIPAIAWYRGNSQKKQADRRIHFLAHHDALTGLANRMQLSERLDNLLGSVATGGEGLAVHLIDLDRFKSVNDALGHDGGDFLLTTMGERIRAVTRPEDVAARLGGDEFVLIQTGASDKEQAQELALRLTSVLSEPVEFEGQEIIATASVGIALAPGDGESAERLLKSADLALYKGKADGRNCIRFFEPEMDVGLQTRIELERAIRHAIANDGFELHFQPLFEIANRRLIGFEALVRLRKADGTLMPPMTFIPVAEEIRVIEKIGNWVLREACRTAATWPNHMIVAVNLSPAQFRTGSICDVVAQALHESGLEPRRLELEITETLLLDNAEAVLAQLLELKAIGVSIAMDDFGTGYSSLSYLWQFPFDKIKIDRSFMQEHKGSDRHAQTIVKAIIALGRELNMRVTVEGIETARQAAFVDDANGDQVQGFFFGRPVPASEVAAEVLANRVRDMEPAVAPSDKEVVRRTPLSR